jgi:peptidoglycan hydrolase CwlO-like protein
MLSIRRKHAARGVLAAVLGLVASLGVAVPSSAQQDPTERREEVRDRQSEVSGEVDALEAQSSEIAGKIDDLEVNVATKQTDLAEANRVSEEAQQDLEDAEADVTAARQTIADLEASADQLVTEAFMNGPEPVGLDALAADSLSDAAVQQAILDMQADGDADLLDRLDAAREDLEIVQAEKETAAEDAADAADAAETALADLEDALAEQQEFAAEVEDSLDQKLIEAENLKTLDRELSQEIERQAAERAAALERMREQEAARLAAAQAANSPAAISAPAPSGGGGGGGRGAPASIASVGNLSTISCPNGGSITVAASIGGNVQGLMTLAGRQGVDICGSGYRDPQRQIELRAEHCGTTPYDIYEKPSSQCSPPTARPGRSMHEQGLAIDFNCNGGGSVYRGNSCWNFLVANANSYGLYNLPSEAWHWSVNGN